VILDLEKKKTLGLCNCDWRICISRIFSPGKIWQIFEPYSLIDFLLYNLRIPTNKRIFYYVSYNNKLAYFFLLVYHHSNPDSTLRTLQNSIPLFLFLMLLNGCWLEFRFLILVDKKISRFCHAPRTSDTWWWLDT
jgi:hypothetical protein